MKTQTPEIDMNGWTPDDLKMYEDAKRAFDTEVAASQAYDDAEAARLKSATYQAQLLREKAEELRVARAEKERELETERELVKAQRAHGADKVAGVRTLRGAIILRAPTANEMDNHTLLLESVNGVLARDKAWREYTAKLVLHPTREAFNKIMEEFPGTWALLGGMREELGSAARAETAKKG